MHLPRPVRTGACLLSLTLGVVLGVTPAFAQLVVEPSSFAVTVPQGEAETRTVTLTNTGSEALAFCLNFDRPLQRAEGSARFSADALDEACGAYGEVLALVDENVLPEGEAWDPYGATMTPDGRLFVADYRRIPSRTHELTPDLDFVRSLVHPVIDEVGTIAITTGVTYNADTGTLWWLNIEFSGFPVDRALLLEGDLDGVPTGRRIELPVAETAPPPYETGRPVGLAYKSATKHYYYVDFANDNVWAVDTLGAVVPGYPITFEAYSGVKLGFGLDAHSTSENAVGLRFEVATNIPGQGGLRRIVTAGALGEDPTPGGAEPLVTPLHEPLPGTGSGGVAGEPVRSVLDPNGVLYYPWSEFQNTGLVAIRPHPLPPSWLVVEAWDGMLAPGESRTLDLAFRPGQRSVGEYTAALQAFTAETGAAVEVPLTLTVTQGTAVETGNGAVPEPATLNVYPNPSANAATVALTLPTDADLRVTVYDVLGRRVANLADGPFAAGPHRLDLDTAALPGGVYLVRVQSEASVLTRRLIIVR